MEHPNYQDDALSAQNPPPYSKEQPYNQQAPPADGPANSAMPTEYQSYKSPYDSVPTYVPVEQPPLHSTIVSIHPTHEPDYLACSICTMLFCFPPLGIAALVYSIRTRDANRTGNSTVAHQNSRRTRNLACCALGVGIVLIKFSCICFLILKESW